VGPKRDREERLKLASFPSRPFQTLSAGGTVQEASVTVSDKRPSSSFSRPGRQCHQRKRRATASNAAWKLNRITATPRFVSTTSDVPFNLPATSPSHGTSAKTTGKPRASTRRTVHFILLRAAVWTCPEQTLHFVASRAPGESFSSVSRAVQQGLWRQTMRSAGHLASTRAGTRGKISCVWKGIG
jgi:hypothetical protein